jgi:hypothetical protein
MPFIKVGETDRESSKSSEWSLSVFGDSAELERAKIQQLAVVTDSLPATVIGFEKRLRGLQVIRPSETSAY